jgi:hypothetical protein
MRGAPGRGVAVGLVAVLAASFVLSLTGSTELAASSTLPATPSPFATSSVAPRPSGNGIPPGFDRVDVISLMATVIEELKNYQGSILVETKTPEAMPPYDPLVFYAGLGAERRQPYKPVVWTVADTTANGYEHALIRAFVMAVMATGEAGPKFKKAYDIAEAEDRSLPSIAPDPYENRHALAEPFVAELTQAQH